MTPIFHSPWDSVPFYEVISKQTGKIRGRTKKVKLVWPKIELEPTQEFLIMGKVQNQNLSEANEKCSREPNLELKILSSSQNWKEKGEVLIGVARHNKPETRESCEWVRERGRGRGRFELSWVSREGFWKEREESEEGLKGEWGGYEGTRKKEKGRECDGHW